MADRRKGKKRKDEESHSQDKSDKVSKDEKKLATWMKANIPNKKTKFANHVVSYFTGSKAVDAIMESEWAKPKKPESEPFFRSRTDVIIFLNTMLRHKMFHRAKKVVVSVEEIKAKLKNKKDKKNAGDTTGDEKKKKEDTSDEADNKKKKKKGVEENKEQGQGDTTKQVGKKIRLEMHFQQVFVDGLDAYVWLFDPLPFYYWIFGFLVVIGAIGLCLFPLWPPSVRMGVQYLSIAGACFIAFIILLAILRLIVFCIVWMLTFGKFHLWLFPNLTEDVGFFASFWPLYQYEFKTDKTSKSKKSKSGKKNKKDKESDEEEEEEQDDDEEEEGENSDQEKQDDDGTNINEEKEDDDNGEGDNASETDSEPSSSQQSQVGKDFEMVEKEEANVEEVEVRKEQKEDKKLSS